jgi:hypothetical protein
MYGLGFYPGLGDCYRRREGTDSPRGRRGRGRMAQGTLPDIAFAVTSLSRYSSCPLQVHSTAAKRVIRYLNTTAQYRLRYRPSSSNNLLHAFTDSDWAGCKSTRKLIGGFLQFYGNDEMVRSVTSTAPISDQ